MPYNTAVDQKKGEKQMIEQEMVDVFDEDVQLEDLTEVPTEEAGGGQQVIPATNGVLFSVRKAEIKSKLEDNKKAYNSEYNKIVMKNLSLGLKLTEGIGEDGKYKNKVVWLDIPVWVDTTIKSSEWWTSKKYLTPLKRLLIAVGYDPKNPPAINQEFCDWLMTQSVVADITVKEQEIFDTTENAWRKANQKAGEVPVYKNEIRNIRSAA